jgi:nitrile hydratase
MDGIHDLGGVQGFGEVRREWDERVFHPRWEGRVFALAVGAGLANVDAFRHAIERLDPVTYLTAGYYGRWLAALERLVAEADESVRPLRGPLARRTIDAEPRFRLGERVVVKDLQTRGHTRCPRYVRRRRGLVERHHGAWVFPDAHAHGRGEEPQHVYGIAFEGRELWGETSEAGTRVSVDLFESYLDVEP